jgi:hypothetical protein
MCSEELIHRGYIALDCELTSRVMERYDEMNIRPITHKTHNLLSSVDGSHVKHLRRSETDDEPLTHR